MEKKMGKDRKRKAAKAAAFKSGKAPYYGVPISSEDAYLDGYGEGKISLWKSCENKERPFFVAFDHEGKGTILRWFPNILRAVRSYRRYVLLSDEIRNGYF